jgi:hypothetical protein
MNFISVVFFGVSAISLVVQLLGLSRMVPEKPIVDTAIVQRLVRQGMIRTAACRVLAAIAYVALSTFLLLYGDVFPIASLLVFIAVQVMWQGNALADVILRRRLENSATTQMGKHRKQFTMSIQFKLYAKAAVQLVGAVLVGVMPLLSTDTPLGASEWVNVALVGVGAAVVWNTQNHPDWPYGKLIGSALMTALTTLNSLLSDGLTRAEIMQCVLALVVTIAVGGFPNAAKEVQIPVSNMNPEGKSTS